MSENRTNEFFTLAKTVPVGGTTGIRTGSITSKPLSDHLNTTTSTTTNKNNNNNNNNNNNSNFNELRTFHTQASSISKDIATTSALLSQLTEKVKHKSILFQEEDTYEVNNLVVRIKQSIENLNSRLDNAAKTIEQQKRNNRYKTSSSSSGSSSGSSSQAIESSTNLVHELQNEFAVAASNFKDVLQQRTESLKENNDFKRQLYYNNNNNNNTKNSNNGNNDTNDEMDDIPDMTSHLLQTPPPIFGTTSTQSTSTSMMGSSLRHSNSTGNYNTTTTTTSTTTTTMFPTLDLTSTLTMSTPSPSSASVLSSVNDTTMIAIATSSTSSSSLPRPHGIPSTSGGGSTTLQYQRSSSSGTPGNMYGNNNNYNNNNNNYNFMLTPMDIQRMEQEEESGSNTTGNYSSNNGNQKMLQFLPTQQSDYLQSRADAMSTVEANIVELGTIFNKLAGLVNEHKELIQRVEDNVDETNTNVLLSMNVLTDTLTSLRTNKMLALKLFSILVAFIIFFIIFFA